MPFRDRTEAGRRLAAELDHLAGADVVVVGLPRGGMVVAAEVAVALRAPLDLVVVRRIPLPAAPEVAMGAVAEGGAVVRDERVTERAGVGAEQFRSALDHEQAELTRRVQRFRGLRPRLPLAGRTAVVVDDGVATGATARAACAAVRACGAARVVLAVPVCAPGAPARLRTAADEVVVVETPEPFRAVSDAYRHFGQVGDDEVVDLLRRAVADRVGATSRRRG
ncbi:phosphoribosyltransferase [Modestobacter roseus]|uniref:Putative phosphoribosyl transferase n=1 Tax=Modestobacter roseus TaxID=1181884 RepID=A0A562ILL8_9ACTN|nr:phosphoribosyltransferase family protein [Modestobacter roseus]TWH71907.1 putative phosphoribosyl transferase [Modestobacter roseus]